MEQLSSFNHSTSASSFRSTPTTSGSSRRSTSNGTICRKLFNRSINFRDQTKKNPHSYYSSDAFHYKEILSESLIKSNLYSYEYAFYLQDRDNIHFSADKFFTDKFNKVYNDDGDLFHKLALNTKLTGKKKKNSQEIVNDKICDVMVIQNPSCSYWNQTVCLTKTNHLYHFNSDSGKLITTKRLNRDQEEEDGVPLYLYLGSMTSGYQSTRVESIITNQHYDSIYFVSNLKDRSAIEVTVLNFRRDSFIFDLKAKFLLKKQVFGKQLSSVALQSSMMLLGYENNEVKVFNLDQLIQNFTVLLAKDVNLNEDYYGMTRYIPLTLDIDSNSVPLKTIDTSITSCCSPFPPMIISKVKRYKNYASSNGLVQLNTNGFCKLLVKSDSVYCSASMIDLIITMKTIQKPKGDLLSGPLKQMFEIWCLKKQFKTDSDDDDKSHLVKVNDPHNLITFDKASFGFSPELISDRHNRILLIHSNFIRNISVNKHSNELSLNYEVNIMNLVSHQNVMKTTSKCNESNRPKRAATKRVISYYTHELVAFDYDSETDLICGLISTGDIFVMSNSNGGGEVISKFNIADSTEKQIYQHVWGEHVNFEVSLSMCMDKIILMYQPSPSKSFATCFKLERNDSNSSI